MTFLGLYHTSYMLAEAMIFLFCIFVLMLPATLRADNADCVIALTDGPTRLALGRHLQYVEDPTGRLTFADIRCRDFDDNWIASKSDVPNFGFSNSAYWVRLPFKNQSEKSLPLLLEYGVSSIREADFYTTDGRVYRAGYDQPFSQRQINYRNAVLPFEFGPLQADTLYVRVRSYVAVHLPFSVYTQAKFMEVSQQAQFGWGLYFGLMIIMALYNLFLFFGLRDINYLYYTACVITMGLFQFSFEGFAFQYLWRESLWWNSQSISTFVASLGFFVHAFCQSFLNTKAYLPRMHRLLTVLKWIIAFIGIGGLFAPFYISGFLMLIFALFAVCVMILTGLIRLWQGFAAAKFFVLGWIALPVGGLVTTLWLLGVIPETPLVAHSGVIGSALEVWLLSLALADRYRVIKLEKEAAQAEALRLQQQTGADLERQVTERTSQLQAANEKLVELDQFKQGMLGMIVHDLKNPLSVMITALDSHSLRSQLDILKQATRQMVHLVQNILDVQKFEDAHIDLKTKSCPLHTLVDDALRQVRFVADANRTQFAVNIPERFIVQVDGDMIVRVLVNLLTNAVKFTPDGGRITVQAEPMSSDWVTVRVVDTGAGIAPENLATVFNKFRQAEARDSGIMPSTGLGLSFCKLAVETHGGQIGVESTPGQGSVFRFTVPGGLESASPGALEKPHPQVQLSASEHAYLAVFITQLRQLEIDEFSEQRAILRQIQPDAGPNIREWLKALQLALDTEDDDLYKELLCR